MLARILRFRGLLVTLTRRELTARYRGSVLGFFWSLANPLLLLGVYTLVFDVIFQPRMAGAEPYAVFLVTGLFPWIWLSTSLLEGADSLRSNSGLIRKAVFPAEILPLVAVVSNLVHFLFALPILLGAVGIAAAFGHDVGGWTMVGLPLAILVQLPFVAGATLALAALNVHFKDVRDLLLNLLTLVFFLTPILYPLEGLREVAAPVWWVVSVNPVTPFVQSYQDLVFNGTIPGPRTLLSAVGLAFISWGIGTWIFDRLRDTLVEAV